MMALMMMDAVTILRNIKRALWQWLRKKTIAIFGFDLRAIALFRIAYSLLILCNIFDHLRFVYPLYDDRGAFPRSIVYLYTTLFPHEYSIYSASGWWPIPAALLLVHAAAALCMLVGYRTRWAAAANWFLLVSRYNRFPLANFYGDDYLRMCSFWIMFLPLDKVWSISEVLSTQRAKKDHVIHLSPGSVAIIGQVILMYVVSVYQKNGAAWRIDGTAIFTALAHTHQPPSSLNRFALHSVVNIPLLRPVLRWLTPIVLHVEFFTPWALVSPVQTSRARLLGALVLFAMHLAFAAFINIWFMSLCFAVPLLLFTEALFPHATSQPHRSVRLKASTNAPLWIFCAVTFCLVTATVMHSAEDLRPSLPPIPKAVWAYIDLLGLTQHWKMYAPQPETGIHWAVFEGVLANGSRVAFKGVDRDLDFTSARPFRDDHLQCGPEGKALTGTPLYTVFYFACRALSLPTNDTGDLEVATTRPIFKHYAPLIVSSISKYICRQWNGHYKDGEEGSGMPLLREVKVWEIEARIVYPSDRLLHNYTKMIWHHSCWAWGRKVAVRAQ
jgi:hypothetical protein